VDRTILPAPAGEDASGAVGVAVVKVRQLNPEPRPKMDQDNPIRICPQLLRESQQRKGSQQ
jgi:hypothetical protein